MEVTPAGERLAAQFRAGCCRRTIWFRAADGGVTSQRADPFVPVALVPAMRRGWTLSIEGPVSERLLQGTEDVQATLADWYPRFKRVEVACTTCATAVPEPRHAVAAFFSGGVDSFYTLYQHRDEITDLVLVHGFDMPLSRLRERCRISRSVREVASELGVRLVEVETNLRQFGEPHVSWPDAYFGAALGAVALFLGPRFDRIYVPGSVASHQLVPMGSHPELDRHWTSGECAVVYDGLEATRFDKVIAIAEWPLVHSHLRVCYHANRAGLNCGRCSKCLWTMMLLRAVGALDRVRTFETPLDIRVLQKHPPDHGYQRDRFVDTLALLEARDADEELQAVMRTMTEAGTRRPLSVRISRLTSRIREHVAHRLPVGN